MTNTIEGLTTAEWRTVAMKLWDILDDIDTLSDMLKPEQTAFYQATMKHAMRRHQWLLSDGYTLKPVPNLEFEPEEGPPEDGVMVRNMSARPDGEPLVGIDLGRAMMGKPPL